MLGKSRQLFSSPVQHDTSWTANSGVVIMLGTLVLIRMSEVQGQEQPVECSAYKIALLFMTAGPMPHARLWGQWLEAAAGLVPLEGLKESHCSESQMRRVRLKCQPPPSTNPVDAQHLFTVYIHPHPKYPAYPEGNVFHKREISKRVEVVWGGHSQTTATKELFKAALADPANQKFLTLSETCIPLYPAVTVYQVLRKERLSRINACDETNYRWSDDYVRGSRTIKIPKKVWRYTTQWVALTRNHAALVAEDVQLYRRFTEVCRDMETAGKPHCHSVESYTPVVLAYEGRDNETDCLAALTWADWCCGRPGHPSEFEAANVTLNLIKRARVPMCLSAEAIRLAAPMFVQAKEARQELCSLEEAWVPHLLDFGCPLFARKLMPSTAAAVEALYSSCKNQLNILPCGKGHRLHQVGNQSKLM
eukprot:jgi/Botrbrau1/14160/Bobra.182_3s0100.1